MSVCVCVHACTHACVCVGTTIKGYSVVLSQTFSRVPGSLTRQSMWTFCTHDI